MSHPYIANSRFHPAVHYANRWPGRFDGEAEDGRYEHSLSPFFTEEVYGYSGYSGLGAEMINSAKCVQIRNEAIAGIKKALKEVVPNELQSLVLPIAENVLTSQAPKVIERLAVGPQFLVDWLDKQVGGMLGSVRPLIMGAIRSQLGSVIDQLKSCVSKSPNEGTGQGFSDPLEAIKRAMAEAQAKQKSQDYTAMLNYLKGGGGPLQMRTDMARAKVVFKDQQKKTPPPTTGTTGGGAGAMLPLAAAAAALLLLR